MDYVKLLCKLRDDPKVVGLSDKAFRVYILALCWCGEHETDGVLPKVMVNPRQAALLLDAGLLDESNPREFAIHNWEKHQISRASLSTKRASGRTRQARYRSMYFNKRSQQEVRERDEDRCRYCGVLVVWDGTNEGSSGSIDHIDPAGPDSIENVVVACRSCNSKKGSRTPDDAGMRLLPPLVTRYSAVSASPEVEEEEERKPRTALRAIPETRPDHDQVYLSEQIQEAWGKGIGIPALQRLNTAHGRPAVTNALRELHGFPPAEAIRSPYAYLVAMLKAEVTA